MHFFIICFGIGLVFLIVTAVMGGLMDVGGHHFDFGGADSGADLGGGIHFSPISPTFISFFLTVFGGIGGISMSLWELQFRWALLLALVGGVGLATLVYLFMVKVFEAAQGGVEVEVADLVGHEGEVITGIPKGGTGEIAFIASGGRLNGPARSADGEAIPMNATVTIVKIIGNTYVVARAPEKVEAPAPRPDSSA